MPDGKNENFVGRDISRPGGAKRAVIESRLIFTMFQVLNGPTYTDDNRPPFWHNEKALMVECIEDTDWVDMNQAPLDVFPLVEDFEVRLELISSVPEFGYQALFYSASRGYIARLAWWDHAEQFMIRDNFKIPFGNFDRPYHGVAGHWDIHIAGKDDFVYVLEGSNSDLDPYHSWFKVRKERYVAEWGRAIEACREAFLTNDK